MEPAKKKCKRSVETLESLSKETIGSFTLADGQTFNGFSFGAETAVAGEVVFNTGMVGYPESLTDPSYRGQILVLTFPLIGNYGVPDDSRDKFGLAKFFESDNIQIAALIVTDYSHHHSHWTAVRALGDWLKEHNVPGLFALDTRMLTKILREKGACLGKVTFANQDCAFEDPNKRNLVAEVSCKKAKTYGVGPFKIVAVDCGIKNNIIRYLVSKGIELKVVPWDTDLSKENYDGLFISNGPGDPTMAQKTVDQIRTIMNKPSHENKPIFGICLGNQIMALAGDMKTYKMKFGNRGMNQPVIDQRTSLCYITPQNHGYAVDSESLPSAWKEMFINANDLSNEGLIHTFKPYFSVQFHPEAMGGPTDTEFLFDMFLDLVRDKRPVITTLTRAPPRPIVEKILLLGSGGLSIGQAGEFDYSGSQAIKALKESNKTVILVNPNIATVQTGKGMADQTYFLPVTPAFVEDVIKKERPDGILLQFGGQTALNCGIQLRDSGVLEKYNVRVLGTPVDTIIATEDRDIFSQKLKEINEKVAPSEVVTTVEAGLKAAGRLGYPVLVRSGFALGGLGSGFANNPVEMKSLTEQAFANSSQVIVDKSLRGWKEVEYEVVRDCKDNCITVCNMENFDPLGIHTGDSIVVAPSQTLSNREYYKLRSTAIKVIRHLGVVGECNIQYALDPNSEDYCIIEVNARLSRSSALASKATGYPLAYVAAKLSLGLCLTDIKNSVTKTTTACFEPALDYVVVKVPRWDMRKFAHVSSKVGSAMKSVGEVMAIGRSFEETFQKAMRMTNDALDGFGDVGSVSFAVMTKSDGRSSPVQEIIFAKDLTSEQLENELSNPSDLRVFAIAHALQRGYSVAEINKLTNIDSWFLAKLKNIIQLEGAFAAHGNDLSGVKEPALRMAKRMGFSDKQIGRLIGSDEMTVRNYRKAMGVLPVVKQIDTLAAEFPAQTNYLYMTYNGTENDIDFKDNGTMVLGCGAYRIGSSCEFDWCAVSCIRTLRKLGHKSIMVNFNPETVSTDYDECDRLYFEELSFERVMDIYETESSSGIVVSVGGQIPNNLVLPLNANGAKILGTSADSIDNAEDRAKFSSLLDGLKIDQPRWAELSSVDQAMKFADEVSYPVLVRPSYVLSGAAMNVATTAGQLEKYLKMADDLSSEHPVVISKFITGAKEIEYDGVARDGVILNFAISEHVENAGVHSGDATLLLPAQKLYMETIKRIKKISMSIASALKITGPFNIQYLSKRNDIKVIECNLRASRSFPFVSKTFNVNFIELATRVILGERVKPANVSLMEFDHVCIKVPMFSFTRLAGADPITRVEMASTGEVACFAKNVHEAYTMGLISSGFKIPKKAIMLSIGPMTAKLEFEDSLRILKKLGHHVIGTEGTAAFYKQRGIDIDVAHKPSSDKSPKILDLIRSGDIDLLINVPKSASAIDLTDGYYIRRLAVDFNISLVSNIKCAIYFAYAAGKLNLTPGKGHADYNIQSWQEYMKEAGMD